MARTLAQLHTYAYGVSKSDVWVHLYGSSHLATTLPGGDAIQLAQVTDYPWAGKIQIKVEKAPAREIALHLRVPGWARSAEVTYNGRKNEGAFKPGTYGIISKCWSPGDIIEINFPMPVELIQSNPLVEENRNQVAIMRGPLVYCLESNDLPQNVNIDDVQIIRSGEWKTNFEPKLLNGVTVLETRAALMPKNSTPSALYSSLPDGNPGEVALKLIPYYAWNNRGVGQMSVWLPILWK